MKNRYKNFLRVFTLFSFFTFLLTYDSYAQFGCGTGVPITNGYTQMGITTPGTAGIEDWNTNPTGTSINSSYWDDDVYLFEYTAGATAENISMTIFTRNGWNGIGIFDDCTGTTFSTELDADGSSTANVSRTVSATIAAGNTVYIAVGQWGTPNDLDFDVTNFTVTQILCPDPSALTATNLTATSADLGWTENGTATTWDIEWGTTGFTPTGTPNIVGTTTNPHNLTGLTAQTDYDFYVRSDCAGNGTSAWVGPYTFTTACTAQLAGTYTIGATGNYATFTDAVNALSCGISAPVIFNVLTGSGPYNEQVTITPVTGASTTNTITFNGNGETITSTTATGSRSLILLDGADYVTINDLVLVPQSTTNNFTVQLTNDADFNTINNCTVDLTAAISSTSTTNAGIVVSGSLTSATSTLASGSNNTISNNTVIGGYYAITLAGANNNMVSNNDIQDFYSYGIYHNTANSNDVRNNTISRPNRTSITTFNGIYYTGSGENNLAEANEIFNPMGGNTTSTSSIYPIYHTGVDATVGNENKVINNIIHSINGNGIIYGLYNSSSDGVFYYHNTVSLDDANATAGTTRGFYQTTTATGIEFKNNIVSVTRGGTGTKHCIYFNAAASVIASNNNVFYINAPAGTNNLGYFSATNQATLVDWQTASSQDASSSDADPLYVNMLSNDYTPTNAAIDGIADASVGVVNDFFGTARAVTPDPGAIEFMPPACPAPSALTASNITVVSADLGWTENGSATTWDIEWGTAGFVPTGTPTILGTTTNPHNLTGLTAQTSYDFYVRADCGGSGTSTWSGPFTFTTECAAVVAPWIESFENAGAIPACWAQGTTNSEDWLFDNTGTGNHIGNNGTITGTTTSGNYFAWVDDSSPHSTGTTLESPFIDVTALTNPMLSFFLISDNEGFTNVDFSVDVWDGAAWNTGVYTSNTNTLNGGWEQINVYLNSLTITGDIKLRFIVDENNGTNFYDDVAIDDVEIKEAPSCPAPSALTATNITATS
ncbi:MAG TPA: fibronectin type III domain-containing protein, partial [Vicingaceae bacterium]